MNIYVVIWRNTPHEYELRGVCQSLESALSLKTRLDTENRDYVDEPYFKYEVYSFPVNEIQYDLGKEIKNGEVE